MRLVPGVAKTGYLALDLGPVVRRLGRSGVSAMRTSYRATVEVATKGELDVDGLMTALARYNPVLETSPRGWDQVRITVLAVNLTQASHIAIAFATAATGARAIACEIMTEQEADNRMLATLASREQLATRERKGPDQRI